MKLKPIPNPTSFHRDYYINPISKNHYCNEDGTWYFCGKGTEPSISLTPEQVKRIKL